MSRYIEDLRDYLAANIEALDLGNTRTDSIDPDISGLQVALFMGDPNIQFSVPTVRDTSATIEVLHNDDNSCYNVAKSIYDLLYGAVGISSFTTTNFVFKRVIPSGDVIRRGLLRPGILNYAVEIDLQYVESNDGT